MGRRCPRTTALLAARLQEAFAAFLDHTDAQIGRLVDALERARRARQHDDRACSPTTAPARRAARSACCNEWKFFNFILETPDEAVDRLDDIGGPNSHTQLPVGLGAGRQHAVQVVQAEHPRGRRARAVHRALAGAHRRRRRAPRPVPPRQRRRARRSTRRSGSHRPTVYRGYEQMPVTGHVDALDLRPRPTRPATKPVQYFEMMGHRGDLRRRLEGRDPPRAGHAVRRRHLGAVPPRRGPLGVQRPRGRRCPRSWPSWSTLWWQRGRGARRAAARRPHDRAVRRPVPRPLAAPRATATTRTARRCRRCRPRSARRSAGAAGTSTRRSTGRPATGGVLYATGTENSGVSACSSRATGWCSTTTASATTTSSSRIATVPVGASVVGVRFRRTGARAGDAHARDRRRAVRDRSTCRS